MKLNRRDVVVGLGSSGLAALAGVPRLAFARAETAPAEALAACSLTPAQTEGPYWFDAHQVRRDVTEGKPGAAFRIVLRVVSTDTCLPLPGALVEIWHADATGLYSGYAGQGDGGTVDTRGQTFLRGLQVADADGAVEFLSIYPGWYRGRTTHVHFKVHFQDRTAVTSQLFFPDAVSTAIHTSRAPYSTRGQADTTNSRDGIYTGTANRERLLVPVAADGAGYVGSLTLGISRSEVVAWVPVVLSAAGANGSLYGSELVLTNRGAGSATVGLTYGAALSDGSGSVLAALSIPAGQQRVVSDAIEFLRSAGLPIPASGDRGGTLGVRFSGLSAPADAAVTVRTTTAVAEGRAGLAYAGVPSANALTEAVYLCGLRQNAADRSNVAFQNLGTESDGEIVLRATAYSGDPATPGSQVLPDVTLAPGGFHQLSGVLEAAGFANGYVKVERVSGESPFYAYGVVNDQANSDGSFVPPVAASRLAGRAGATLPVVVETPLFSSELVVTNFGTAAKTLDLAYVADAVSAGDATARTTLTLLAGEQKLIPNSVAAWRAQGVSGIGAAGPTFAGALFCVPRGGDLAGIVLAARTSAPGGGGRYGLFYPSVPFGSASTANAWLYGLRQDETTRSNLALVNTGETDANANVFALDLFDGATGQKVKTVEGLPVGARRWLQIDGVLAAHAPGVTQGYAQVRRTAGTNPFVAYAVVNDGGQPGQRSGDGAFVASA